MSISLYEALRFVIDFINPTSISIKANEIINTREQEYKSHTYVNANEIFPYFFKLEYLIDYLVKRRNIDQAYKLKESESKRRILDLLFKLEIINEMEFEILTESLSLRNLVVHAKVQKLNQEELKLVKDSIKIILSKLILPVFEIYRDAKGSYRARFRDENGDIILLTEGFLTKANCMNAIESIKKNAPDGDVDIVD